MNNSYDYLDNVLTDGQSNSVNFENYLDKLMYVTAPFVFNDNFSPIEQNLFPDDTITGWPLDSYTLDIAREVDIFSDLDGIVFSRSKNEQMALLMEKFRTFYYEKLKNIKSDFPLPKLKYFEDSEGADTVQLSYTWRQGNVILYFSFDKIPTESSYGLIWDDKPRKSYESRIRNISLNKTDDIINEVCDFILRVFI